MKILVFDNYDSFTYNLVYMLRQTAAEVDVYRNDKINPKQCLNYDGIILSPGPGIPKNAGNLMGVIETCAGKIPILGVCLGHQAIAEYLGGEIQVLSQVHHGVQSTITQNLPSSTIFKNLAQNFQAGRYHSWSVATADAPQNFEITAVAEDRSIMGIQNTKLQLYGIQFHPESILTPEGNTIIQNFLSICKELKR